MRSLAVKIFIGFWTTHAIIFAVLALAPDRGGDYRFLDRARHDGQVAASLFESGGEATCAQFLATVEKHSADYAALYDQAGEALCRSSNSVDPAVYRQALAGVAETGVFETGNKRRAAVLSIAGASGKSYRFATVTEPGGRRDTRRPFVPYNFLITSAIVSALVCLFLARYLAAPLQRLSRATHRLKEGDLSARAGLAVGERNDEIGDVVRDFDSMAERIESLMRLEKQLLSDISHELRSPLARLNVALELARRTAGPAADSHLARIENEAERMNELIGKLLALARAENVGREGHTEEYDLEEIVQRVADDAEYEARRLGKRVELSVQGKAVLRGDPELTASAVENVVRNAVRYTAAGTAVEIAVTIAGTAQIVVRDHGPGVPEADLETVFVPFRRLDASRDRESGGIGLGLSIAQRAVITQNGAIVAQNAEGGGLKITLTLPITPR